jgi:Hg(II)-responsive transcriptional regulator
MPAGAPIAADYRLGEAFGLTIDPGPGFKLRVGGWEVAMGTLTIGRLASAAEVGIDTVRFYERAGLLRKPQRTAAGYRLYAESDVARLRFIRRAKALGFSLVEIAELLRLNDGGGRREAVRALAGKRLAEIEQKVSELGQMRATLRHLLDRCRGDGPLAGCPIIEAVLRGEASTRPVRRVRRSA